MPGAPQVRDLDDGPIPRLESRAARHGRSAEAEHREIRRQALAAEADPSFADLPARLRALTRGRARTPAAILRAKGATSVEPCPASPRS